MRRLIMLVLGALLGACAFGADLPKPEPTPGRVMLPQEHQYQRVLRAYMATLTEQDFEHGITEKLAVPPLNPDLEHQYRTYIMAMLETPHVGGKRGIPTVNAPSHNYLLSTMEGEKAIIVPPVWVESLGTFIAWDSPGNHFYNNRALKMRAFVAAAVKMMMVDDHLEKNAGTGIARADWNCYHLINSGSPYPAFKDALPPPVRQAYETGLLNLGRKLLAMGPKGEDCDYEMGVAVGLWYVARATGDAAFMKEAEAYARTLCTDPRFFNQAGYWNEAGGLDVGFGGMANFWAVWLALASDWPFAREAVDKVYRLRAHLILPEPDGTFSGPSAFNNRIGSPAGEDQWDFNGTREHGAAMITDEAAFLPHYPTEEQLAGAMAKRTATFNSHLYGNLRNHPKMVDGKRAGYLENHEIRGHTWVWRSFPNGWNYPVEVNPAYEFYRQGACARFMTLQKENSPLLKSPFLREGTFINNFANAFIVAKRPGFAAILHVGPVGDPAPGSGMAEYKGPLGFGGGQLSAFWTPSAGSVLLGRRSAIQMRGPETVNHDKFEAWRTWPHHAVCGVSAEGVIFTSARIAAPAVTADVTKDRAHVTVSGAIPAALAGQEGSLRGTLAYARVFHLDDRGVRVETTVKGDGKDKIAELYETLPVFLRDAKIQPKAVPTSIEFQVGGKWTPATAEFQDKVTAVKLTRFDGAVQITFAKPQRVKLSPEEWKDAYLTRGVCRNVLIDLLGGGFPGERIVSYTIAAVAK